MIGDSVHIQRRVFLQYVSHLNLNMCNYRAYISIHDIEVAVLNDRALIINKSLLSYLFNLIQVRNGYRMKEKYKYLLIK